MLSNDDIARIADRIVARQAPLVVGTFGSYAIGTARAGSDLDLFVIKDGAERPVARRRAIERTLFSVLHPLDMCSLRRNSRRRPMRRCLLPG